MSSSTHRMAATSSKRANLEGMTVAGGELSRTRFSKLLGVAALSKLGFVVRSVAWVGDHVEVEVEQPDGESVVFSIERQRQDQPGFLTANTLNVFYQGKSLDKRLEAALRAVAPRALSRFAIESLVGLISSDPQSGRPVEPLPSTPEADQQSYDEQALLATWGSPAVWTSFFAVAEVARSQLDSLDFFDRCTFVQHCDLECLCVNPQVGVPLIPIVQYPWEDQIRRHDWSEEDKRRISHAHAHDEDSPGMVTTDLDERDVVLGQGPQLLERALTHLQGAKKLGTMVFCSTTCVPVVEGEDVGSVIERAKPGFDVPVLSLTTTPQSMQGVFRELLVTRRLEAESRLSAPEEHTINLVGFPDDPSTRELESALEKLGIQINVKLLPALSPELIDRFPAARLNVLHPNELWRGLYDQILFDSRVPDISPPAPYGIRATAAWLDRVVEELGLEVADASSEAMQPSGWKELVARARAHRLGFVIRASDAHILTDPANTWGIPLARLIEEMGFAVALFVHLRPSDDGERVFEELRAIFSEPSRHDLISIENPTSLELALRESPLGAIFSEHAYDRRATESGLVTFNGQYFERGYLGACRSLQRLLEVCELPFFSRYGPALSRARKARGEAHPLGMEGAR